VQPSFEIIKDQLCLRLSEFDASFWWRSACFLLNRIELRDAPDGFICDGGTLKFLCLNAGGGGAMMRRSG